MNKYLTAGLWLFGAIQILKADEFGFVWAPIVVMKRLKHHPHLLSVVYVMDSRICLTPDRSNVSAPLQQVCLLPASGELATVRQTPMETTLFR